jgi:hypothetical protein
MVAGWKAGQALFAFQARHATSAIPLRIRQPAGTGHASSPPETNQPVKVTPRENVGAWACSPLISSALVVSAWVVGLWLYVAVLAVRRPTSSSASTFPSLAIFRWHHRAGGLPLNLG